VRWLRRASGVIEALGEGGVAVAVLDLNLPDGDGLALCRDLRAAGHGLPVLMLTARGTLDDRLEGFAAGADDYLPKPFALPNWPRASMCSSGGRHSFCRNRSALAH
jgi:DNA-binding response OmpR family regulator